MKRFDLTFKGEVLPKYDPKQVKARFAELFRIEDPGMLDTLFCGDTFVLHGNLDRRTASDYYHKMSQLGGQVQLVASTADSDDPTPAGRQQVFVRILSAKADTAGTRYAQTRAVQSTVLSMASTRRNKVNPKAKMANCCARDVLKNLESLRMTTEHTANAQLQALNDLQEKARRNEVEQTAAIASERLLAEEFAAVERSRLLALQADTQRDLERAIRQLSQQITAVKIETKQKIGDLELAKAEQHRQHEMELSELQTLIDLAEDDKADQLEALLLFEQKIRQQRLMKDQQLEKQKSAISEKLSHKLERLAAEEHRIVSQDAADQS